MASLVSSDTTHGEPSFVPRNASIASGVAGKVIANGWGGSKSLSTSRKRTARRCYDHHDLRAICLLSRPAVAWINAIETGLARDRARRVPGGRRENAWTVGLDIRQFRVNAAFVRLSNSEGRVRRTQSSTPAGKVNWNIAPRGRLASAHKRPPWASMMDRQIESPIPIPLVFVV